MSVWNEPLLQIAVFVFFTLWFAYSALMVAVVVKESEVDTYAERFDVVSECLPFAIFVAPVLLFWDIKKVIQR